MTVTLTEFTRQPCNSARGRKTGGWHPNLKPIHMYPDYYWCTQCGTHPRGGARLEGWKDPKKCWVDKGGALRCPDCNHRIRTHPKPSIVLKGRRRAEKRRALREANK